PGSFFLTPPHCPRGGGGLYPPPPASAGGARGRAAAPDLANRVRFRGPLGPAALAGLLRDSALLAVPSTHEGFGIVYLEGFAFGLPALAAASGGAAEIVNDGETGWSIRESESGGAARRIADRLETLAADRGRLAAMGLRAAETHRSHPTWLASAAAVEDLFTLPEASGRRDGDQ
ncbi:MAG: glycosyltransferase family 4 protein, partial [Acidobacteria bacterium]|nr:glycosyltransferase family 4 protein [Acidobacteriota bacterium]